MNTKKLAHRQWLVQFSLIAFLILAVLGQKWEAAKRNVVYLTFTQTMLRGPVTATRRQSGLKQFALYLYPEVADERFSETSMLESIFIGDYYYLHGEKTNAARWYMQAALSTPYPWIQNSLGDMYRENLLPDGNILITDFSEITKWIPDTNNNVTKATFESAGNIARLTYRNEPEQRDVLAYTLYPAETGMVLGYHNVLTLRCRIHQGTFLTLEVKTEEGFVRLLNYYRGTGDWEIFKFPLTGKNLQAVKISLSESSKDLNVVDSYGVDLDWLHLTLE